MLTLCSQVSSDLVFRGRKLVLQYKNGSPCGPPSSKALEARKESDDEEDDDDNADKGKDKNKDKGKDTEGDGHRRKSTIISFQCDKEPSTAGLKATVSFVGTDPDECAYFFEVRSSSACGGAAEPVQQGLGPGGVFAIIALIAICVYFIGGVMYQRSVAHARGWRQLPNYSLWAGIGSFIQVSLKDLIAGAKQVRGPRVASVRDGILPTMEHRPITKAMHRSYGSRSMAAYPP
jgi:cation-dependent mannose-6-phosphate receptor